MVQYGIGISPAQLTCPCQEHTVTSCQEMSIQKSLTYPVTTSVKIMKQDVVVTQWKTALMTAYT